jgi:hypothetical protein
MQMLFGRACRYTVATFLLLVLMLCTGSSGIQWPPTSGSLGADFAPRTAPSDPPTGTDVGIYVSPRGSDRTGNGSASNPYRTIGRALQAIPLSVSQHYIINLAAGTYREQINISGRYFGSTHVGNFNRAAIELRGDPSAADDYVISGADTGDPALPVRDYAVVCSFANCILHGVSLQYAAVAGFYQVGGVSVIYNSHFRHFTNIHATGLFLRSAAMNVLRGDSTIDDAYFGVQIAGASKMFGYKALTGGDFLNTGFPDPSTTTVSNATKKAIQVYEDSLYYVSNTTSVSCTGASSSGLEIGDGSHYDSETTTVSGCTTSVLGYVFGRIEINYPTFSNATTGVKMIWNSRADWLGADPTFNNVTTQYDLSGGSVVTTPTQNLFDGALTSTGDINLAAEGTTGNITLTPGSNGNIVLNGLVGIGKASTGAKLMIAGSGGSQTYVDVEDQEARQDTLVNLSTTGRSDDSFFLRARSQGIEKWWVKGDGSAFSTSFATALNIVPYSASPVFDASLGNTQEIILAGDVTTSTLLNARPGQDLVFIVCQDANGGHRFAWPPNFKGGMSVGGVNIVGEPIGTAPSTCSTQSFIYDGTTAYAVSHGVTNM